MFNDHDELDPNILGDEVDDEYPEDQSIDEYIQKEDYDPEEENPLSDDESFPSLIDKI